MKESLVSRDFIFISDHKTSKRAKPGKSPLDLVSSSVSVPHATILPPVFLAAPPVWRKECGPSFFQPVSERVTVIPLVGNESLGPRFGATFPSIMDPDVLQGLFSQDHFRRRGRVDVASQWNTLTIDHHHPLRSFAPLGFSDCRAPFFAGAKLPSMKASFQSRMPCLSSWERKVRQIFSHTPSSSQRLSLLQQVAGLGYRSGRSFPRAPVRKTHRIPSITLRSFALGRPLLRGISSLGSKGSIFSHCSSVKNSVRRLIGSPPVSLIREKAQKYKYLFVLNAISITWLF